MKNEKIRGYRTISECAKMAEVSRTRLYNAIAKKLIKNKKINGKTYINLLSFKTYIENINRDAQGGWGGLDTNVKYYPLPGYDYLYATNDNGEIVNLSNGKKMTTTPNSKYGYIQIWLSKQGKTITKQLSHLIVSTQGDNNYDKCYIHHIDRKKENNRISNLLPVWDYQHKQLHILINNGKIKEYEKMIEEIKKENAEKVYKIPDVDFGTNDKNNMYWMYVTAKGYQHYISGEDVPFAEIKAEYYRK